MKRTHILGALCAAMLISSARAQTPTQGTTTTLAGLVGIDTHTHKAFGAAVLDVKAYTFTGVKLFGLRTVDLHLYPGIGQNGRVAGGGSLGRSFQLADQVTAFGSIGLVTMQGITGFQPHIEGGIIIRW